MTGVQDMQGEFSAAVSASFVAGMTCGGGVVRNETRTEKEKKKKSAREDWRERQANMDGNVATTGG